MTNQIRELIQEALQKLNIQFDNEIQVERTRRFEHGHFASNIALMLPKLLRRPPIKIAEEIVNMMPDNPELISKIEIKKPGFINFFLSPEFLQSIIQEIFEKGADYGRSNIGNGKKVQVEFVSANPTGPLTVGHGRQAVLGDSIARIMEWNGYEVHREYYYNDAGRQMRILGLSTYTRYRQILGNDDKMPDDYYQGEYLQDVAREIVDRYADKFADDQENEVFKKSAEEAVFRDINNTLKNLGIVFDNYYNEKTLYEDGKIDEVLSRLEEMGASYEKDGAVWFRGSKYGVADDRVLWKSVADEATYRLPDIAYHETKYKRGFDIIIDVFGADHHATYPDILAGLKALGYDTDRIKVVIHQFVTLTRGGEKVKMSTRKATFVTLDELIEEVGKDVVRYFFIMRSMKSHLDFDLELAKNEGDENPVFYLQYAHARIASIFRKAKLQNVSLNHFPDTSLLKSKEELNLLYTLSEFKEIIIACANNYEPQTITTYLQKLATSFHKFYTECQVLGDDTELSLARLALANSAKIVLSNGLNLIGISTPDRM